MSSRDARKAPPRLLVEIGGRVVKVAVASDAFSLGSDESCSLCLEHEGVARRHAVIQRNGDQFELFDLLSPTGTFVNGRRIEAAPLKSGDQIRLGPARLTFLAEAATPGAPTSASNAVTALEAAAPKVLRFADEAETLSRAAPATVAAATTAVAAPPPPPSSPPAPADAALPAPKPVPAPAETPTSWPAPGRRAAGDDFATMFVEQLRRTPFMLTSLLLHVGLLLLFSILSEKHAVPEVVGPLHASMDFVDEAPDDATSHVDAPPEPEISELPETAEPDVVEPSSFTDPVADPLDSETEAERGPEPDDGPFPFRAGASGAGDDGSLETGPFRGGAPAGGPSLRDVADELRGQGLDVVFVLDATGSMETCLDDARRRINDAVAVLSAIVPGFRLGLVAYRDRNEAFLVKTMKLTADHYQVVDFLDDLRAEGGGDIPEAVDEALRTAASSMGFGPRSRRIFILVGDAPPHPANLGTARSVVDGLRRSHAVLHTVYCPTSTPGDDDVRRFFGDLAARGNGAALELHEGRRLLDEVLPMIFGAVYRDQMASAVEDVVGGRRATRWRRAVSESDAVQMKRRLLERSRSTPYLVNAAAQALRADHLPAYLDVLCDRTAPTGVRWACHVFVKRLLRAARAPAALLAHAAQLRPDASPDVLADRLSVVRAGLAKLGMNGGPVVDVRATPTSPRGLEPERR